MSLYQIQFDGEQDYVEAASFGAAVKAWVALMRAENGPEFDDEPDGVTLLSTKPVLRSEVAP